jgi:hypothetical protein
MVSTTSLTTGGGRPAGIAAGRLRRAGILAAPLAAVSSLAIRTIGVAVGAVPASYQPLQPFPIIIVSLVAALVAAGLFVALARWARRPLRTFRLIALICLLLSFAGPLQAGAGKMQGGAASGATVITMLLMHVVAAAVIVATLTTLGRAK